MRRNLMAEVVCALVLIAGSCSKNAKVAGVVVDAATGQGMAGVEIWATSDNLGKKVVGKTGKGGSYELSLPASEWLLAVNPIESSTRLQTYLTHASTTKAYEKDRKLLDTTWLLPCPSDSTRGIAYVIGRGSGVVRVEPERPQHPTWMGNFFDVRPTFAETREPYALLAYDRDGSFGGKVGIDSAEVRKATSNTFMSDGPIPDLWYVVPGQQIHGTSTTAVGSWRLVFFPSKLTPGKYCIDLPGVTSQDEMLLFEVLDVAPPRSATGERPE